MSEAKGTSHWVGIIVGLVTILAVGATIVARFNTLENAKDRHVEELVSIRQEQAALGARLFALEVEKESVRSLADVKKDVAVLNERLNAMDRRRRGD